MKTGNVLESVKTEECDARIPAAGELRAVVLSNGKFQDYKPLNMKDLTEVAEAMTTLMCIYIQVSAS